MSNDKQGIGSEQATCRTAQMLRFLNINTNEYSQVNESKHIYLNTSLKMHKLAIYILGVHNLYSHKYVR